MFCEKCGTELDNETKFCTNCGAPVSNEGEVISEETATLDNAASTVKAAGEKKPRKMSVKIIASIMAAAVLAIVLAFNWAYAKNLFMKLILPSDKYFAYVVGSNTDDVSDTLAKSFAARKGYMSGGVGGNAEIEIKKGEGLEKVLSSFGLDYVIEEIDWINSASLSVDANYKDNKTGADIGVKLNGVDLGTFSTVVDMNDMMSYIGIPMYNSGYLSMDMSQGYDRSDYTEAEEMIEEVMDCLPDERTTKKLLNKYIKVVANSVEDVEEKTEKITADGVSQKVTKLSFDVDGALIKNISINFLNEIKEDKELKKIIEDIADATDSDTDDLWEELDAAVEHLEDMDDDYFMDPDLEINVSIFVNSRGEIVGFELDAEDVSIEGYLAEKGNKFGINFNVNVEGRTLTFEGGGKQSWNKRTGEFELTASGMQIAKVEVKDIDTKKFKKGLFDGSVTIKCGDAIDNLRLAGMDAELLEVISSLALTINSSQDSAEKYDCTISLDYNDQSCVQLSVKGSMQESNNVKIPSKTINPDDSNEVKEWIREFDFDKLLGKLREANLPDYLINDLEDGIDMLEDNPDNMF